MSSNSLQTGLEDLANLRLPWKPGGLCSMEGLDMEVTMMDVEALHPDLDPDSLSTLSSCWRRERSLGPEIVSFEGGGGWMLV